MHVPWADCGFAAACLLHWLFTCCPACCLNASSTCIVLLFACIRHMHPRPAHRVCLGGRPPKAGSTGRGGGGRGRHAAEGGGRGRGRGRKRAAADADDDDEDEGDEDYVAKPRAKAAKRRLDVSL